MGIRFIVNGRIVDNGEPAAELDTPSSNPATNSDGRTYLPYTNAVVSQNGTITGTANRVDIGGNALPPSGNISKSYPGNKMTEANDGSDQIRNLQKARAQHDAAVQAKAASDAAAYASATNLQAATSITGAKKWQVKPTQ